MRLAAQLFYMIEPISWFFFQAEDGIRDIGVTGVQTCALPICGEAARLGEAAGGRTPGEGSPFRQGLLTNLLNPKMALLFLTLLPQFVADGEPRVATTAVLAGVFLLNAVIWWRAFSLAIGPLGRFLSRPRVVTWFDRGTGALLVGLGVRVALERR